MRPPVVISTVLLTACGMAGFARAQELPVVRNLLQKVIISELKSHDSQESAWYNEKSKDKKKVAQFNFFGREVDHKVASWTEESKTWFWIDDPDHTLSLTLSQLTIKEDRVEFALSARAKAGFRVWGRIPRLGKANASGTVWVEFDVAGSAAVGKGGLKDAQITKLAGKLNDLQFNNDLASPLERLVVDALNDHVRDKNDKLRASVEKAINRVKF
jgi:hypothetical protein